MYKTTEDIYMYVQFVILKQEEHIHSFFYKNIFYKNIEAAIREILRIF